MTAHICAHARATLSTHVLQLGGYFLKTKFPTVSIEVITFGAPAVSFGTYE